MPLIRSLFPIAMVMVVAFSILAYLGDSGNSRMARAQGLPQGQQAFPGLMDDEGNTVAVVQRYGPRVVAVNVSLGGRKQSPFQQEQQQGAGGSGFVVDEEQRIITNLHVILSALRDSSLDLIEGASITVSFLEIPNREFPVRVRGANPDFDLALLEFVDPKERPQIGPIPLGDSDKVVVGQKVIAIGNPFGLQSTVTSGIVSAIERGIPSIVGIEIPYIQTDAAINPGNSGGPLLNSRGEVVGLNNVILAPTGAFAGIGFAVPSNLLRDSMDDLLSGGLSGMAAAAAEIRDRPRIGLVAELTVNDYPDEVRREFNLPPHGAVVTEVAPGSAGARAGLQGPEYAIAVEGLVLPAGGDIITAIDGQPVHTVQDIQRVILEKGAGDVVELRVWRDGQERVVRLPLEIVPQNGFQLQGMPMSSGVSGEARSDGGMRF